MEENNNNVETNNGEAINNASQGSYITGTIGAVIGGAIASLPWVLVYVYGNMIVAILAVLIALGAFYGYKLAKGKMGKGLPAIIAIVSVAIIVILTTVVCPLVILSNLGVDPSFDTIERVYSDSTMVSAIMQDALVSIAFTIVGIAGTIKSMKMQIKSGATDIKFSEQPLTEQFQKYVKEQAEETKKAFDSLGALNSENTAEKREIINELTMTHNVPEKRAKANFQLLYNNRVIKKVKGKYYYDAENEDSNISNARQNSSASPAKTTIITLVVIFAIMFAVIIIGVIATNSDKSSKSEKVKIPNTSVSMNITSDYNVYDTKEEILKRFGEELASYYDFAILDKDNKIEVYGLTKKKEELTGDFTLDQVIEEQKTISDQAYDNVSEIKTKKLGKIDFKYITYSYGTTTVIIGNTYVAEVDGRYLMIIAYADEGNQSVIDSAMKTIFK